MPDREKIVKELERCVLPHGRGCTPECEYHGRIECCRQVMRKALALLKKQEAQPRVMSLEEVKDAKGSGVPVYVENLKARYSEMAFVHVVDGFDEFTHITFHGESSIFGHCCKDYGVSWRVWTARPSEKQRKAAAWDD